MVSAQAAIGDVVSPRERGRYLGFFGAVFGVRERRGPLIGGFFTTNLSWRWIFYINLPLGALALVASRSRCPARASACSTRSTTWARCCSAVGLASIVLLTTLGGTTYAWGSAVDRRARASLAVAGARRFVFVERRAAEPILPPRCSATASSRSRARSAS